MNLEPSVVFCCEQIRIQSHTKMTAVQAVKSLFEEIARYLGRALLHRSAK